MANRYQRGDLLGVRWALFSGALGPPVSLNIKGWTMDDTALLFDVTHTGLNGIGTARIAGKGDASGNVTADHDGDIPWYLINPGVVKGAPGLLLMLITPTAAIQQPAIIEKVHWESAIESELKINFDWKQNVLAGLPTYPAFGLLISLIAGIATLCA